MPIAAMATKLIQVVAPYILWVIVAIIVGIVYSFTKNFWIRSRRIGSELQEALAALVKFKSQKRGNVVDLDAIANRALQGERLAHLWKEYRETLHPQKEVDSQGQEQITRWRATTVAETFFTEQVLVDTPLKSEFYKHLPGILTGLGIIGTFSGLIFGLLNFQVSEDPLAVRDALSALIQSVGHAFIVSAIAIGLAMIITWVEKSQITRRYAEVEGLCQFIDGLFDAGAGEEYLSRLVTAAESSATQAAHIKDSIVTDLKQVLSELTTQQIRAAEQHSLHLAEAIKSPEQREQLASGISVAIAESLKPSMDGMIRVAERVGANQGDAINTLLADVLTKFASQMEGMYGGQLQGINELLEKATQSLSGTVGRFEQIAVTVSSAGKDASTSMAEKMQEAMVAMEARQQALNGQMGEFVANIREMVNSSQTESARKLEETLTKLGEQVDGLIGQLGQQVRQTANAQEEQNRQFVEHTSGAVSSLSGQMESLIAQSVATNMALQESVLKLTGVATSSVDKMNSGAETLYLAVSDLAKAGKDVAGTMQAASVNTERIRAASELLSAASIGIQKAFEDYKKTTGLFAAMVAELKLTIEAARHEGSMTTELVGKLKEAAEQLGVAEGQAQKYLEGVSSVLTKTHESFAENIKSTLQKGNSQFHKELSEAVGLLSGAIQDLAEIVETIPGRK